MILFIRKGIGMNSIQNQHCEPCEGIGTALQPAVIANLLPQIAKDWIVSQNQKQISRDFRFKNYYQTISFVNAIAWMANLENHHPDLEVGFNHCLVHYTTHALNGLSHNDFICAAKVDKLYEPYAEKQKP